MVRSFRKILVEKVGDVVDVTVVILDLIGIAFLLQMLKKDTSELATDTTVGDDNGLVGGFQGVQVDVSSSLKIKGSFPVI